MDSLDKLTIDTPEQIAIEFHLAGIGSRFLAIAFDMLVQFIGYVVLALIAALALGGELRRIWPSAWNWSAAVFIFVVFCFYWGYYAFFETIWKGQTPGKRRAGIRVIKDTGRSITAFEAIARNLVRVHGEESTLDRALGADFKGRISIVVYVAGIVVSFVQPVAACLLYLAMAVVWLVPDRRIERSLRER